MAGNPVTPNPLEDLTVKQREVLDLLILHKTSKEISRSLGISPHTVDQRINLARGKLRLSSRNQVAQEYRRLVQTYEQTVYQNSDVATSAIRLDQSVRDKLGSHLVQSQAGLALPGRTTLFKEWEGVEDFRVCPELLDGPWGNLARLGVITGIAVLLVAVVLGGLSTYSLLSQVLSR
jgi:DNA-binding CsgD family transcriptional regulator